MIGMCIYASDSLLEMEVLRMVGSSGAGDPSEQKGRAGRRALMARSGTSGPTHAFMPGRISAGPLLQE